MKEISIYFDGGCAPNPGKAYGSYEVVCPSDESLNHKSSRQKFGDGLTNNQAEYLALLAALKWLSHQSGLEEASLEIKTDSLLVKNELHFSWRCKLWYLKELRDECRNLLRPFKRWRVNWHARKNNVARFGH